MVDWLKWIGLRAPILPVAWVLAHATVLLWKALDPRYIDEAQWIVDVILKPLHPLGVWLVGVVMPPLRTLVSNMPPGLYACPYHTNRAGRSCGNTSAYVRPGGYSPLCYAKDVTPGMIADERVRISRTAEQRPTR